MIVNIEIFTNRHAYHYVSLSTGKRTGTIASRELPTLPAGLIYRVQGKAWFSEDIMLEWIEDVLKPYVANIPPGIVPILFLDSFTVHKMGSVVNAIQALGIEIDFIPPGCTSMVQPVDVGYNKPFKAKLREQYRNYDRALTRVRKDTSFSSHLSFSLVVEEKQNQQNISILLDGVLVIINVISYYSYLSLDSNYITQQSTRGGGAAMNCRGDREGGAMIKVKKICGVDQIQFVLSPRNCKLMKHLHHSRGKRCHRLVDQTHKK